MVLLSKQLHDENVSKTTKIPEMTHNIEQLQMLEFRGKQLLLVVYDNKKAQAFDYCTGTIFHDFNFDDNVLELLCKKNVS